MHNPLRRLTFRSGPFPSSSLVTWRDRIALSPPVIALGRLVTSLSMALTERRRRPWLAMIAIPLEMSATMSMLLWWTWPLLIFAIWWWSDTGWRWTWLVGVEAGLFGTQWTYAGALALGNFPKDRPLVATIWIGVALSLAAASAHGRRQNDPVLRRQGG